MPLSAEDSRTAIGGALIALGTLGAIVVTGGVARFVAQLLRWKRDLDDAVRWPSGGR